MTPRYFGKNAVGRETYRVLWKHLEEDEVTGKVVTDEPVCFKVVAEK
jgi:hypothetical protein